MAQNGAEWAWTKPRERAARLLAEDEQTDDDIAVQLHVGRRTLVRWKAVPDFAARVESIHRELGDLSLRYAIGRRARRLAELESRRRDLVEHWESLRRLIAERAAVAMVAEASGKALPPGARTGQLTSTIKLAKGGGEPVEVWEFDAALARELREVSKELREHEKQAAQELGQWTEVRKVEARVTGVVEHLSDADLECILREEEAKSGPGPEAQSP